MYFMLLRDFLHCFMYYHPMMHCRWYRVKFASLLQQWTVFCLQTFGHVHFTLFDFIRSEGYTICTLWNSQKRSMRKRTLACTKNVIGLGTWLYCQIKLVVRTFKNTQNLKIVKMWVIPLVHDVTHTGLKNHHHTTYQFGSPDWQCFFAGKYSK